ncbi:MAG: tRNA 2-thiocytidine biosynthesis TtcA family protein [Anaerolineae bacterium]
MATPDAVARFLLKDVNRAVRDFDLISDGDRIAVGVSGGKDSRTLLDLLVRGVDIPGDYEVVAIHVDGSPVGLPNQAPRLAPWFQELDVPYEITPLMVPEDEELPMNCFRCAWNRRKTLFFAADRLGCNKVAFGHHADDAAVTTLMSLMYKGQLETLAPRLSFFDDHFIVIRPLIYLSAAEIERYARVSGWTFPPEPVCPREEEARRVHFERFLSTFSSTEREQIRANLWRAAHEHGDVPSTGAAGPAEEVT